MTSKICIDSIQSAFYKMSLPLCNLIKAVSISFLIF